MFYSITIWTARLKYNKTNGKYYIEETLTIRRGYFKINSYYTV